MDAAFVVNMDLLASPLASRLTNTHVTSQKTQFYLLYRDLRHATTATTINRSQMLHEHGV